MRSLNWLSLSCMSWLLRKQAKGESGKAKVEHRLLQGHILWRGWEHRLTTWPRRRENKRGSSPMADPLESGQRDSNSWPSPWQGDVLPLNYARSVPIAIITETPGRGKVCVAFARVARPPYHRPYD